MKLVPPQWKQPYQLDWVLIKILLCYYVPYLHTPSNNLCCTCWWQPIRICLIICLGPSTRNSRIQLITWQLGWRGSSTGRCSRASAWISPSSSWGEHTGEGLQQVVEQESQSKQKTPEIKFLFGSYVHYPVQALLLYHIVLYVYSTLSPYSERMNW